MNFLKGCLLSFIFIILGNDVLGQWEITEDEQFYRVRVWRRIDLRDKQNKGFFARDREITKFILEGLESGELKPYSTDLKEEQTSEDFFSNIQKSEGQAIMDYDPQVTYAFGEFVKTSDGNVYMSQIDGLFGVDPASDPVMWSPVEDQSSLEAISFSARDFAVLEIVEDIIFDKRRSRLYYDIEGIKLIVPGDIMMETLGQPSDVPYAAIKYDELEPMLRANPEAKWVNRYNPKEWKNFADAFLLRLFTGPIVQYENPDGLPISDMFPGHYNAVMEMVRYEMQLMEKEHNLWEY